MLLHEVCCLLHPRCSVFGRSFRTCRCGQSIPIWKVLPIKKPNSLSNRSLLKPKCISPGLFPSTPFLKPTLSQSLSLQRHYLLYTTFVSQVSWHWFSSFMPFLCLRAKKILILVSLPSIPRDISRWTVHLSLACWTYAIPSIAVLPYIELSQCLLCC